MPSTPIKSCNKYVLSYKDTSNKMHQLGFYARDAYDCLMLAREFNTYVHDHPGSVFRIQQKFWGKIMNSKKSPVQIKDKDTKYIKDKKDYKTVCDLIVEQDSSSKDSKTVHRRRDLDSLG